MQKGVDLIMTWECLGYIGNIHLHTYLHVYELYRNLCLWIFFGECLGYISVFASIRDKDKVYSNVPDKLV